MIVVADTSPINYLVLIEHIDILSGLYHRVLIPSAVQRELQHKKTPRAVRDWMAMSPDWLEVRSIKTALPKSLGDLDAGEAEAIALAEEIHAERIAIDETHGRRIAEAHGLEVIGTLGILREAAHLNLLSFRDAVERLQQNGFHIKQKVLDEILADF